MLTKKKTIGMCLAAVMLLNSGCKDKKNANDYVQSGERLYRNEQLEKARVEFRNALAVDERSAAAHYGLALVAMRKEDHTAQRYHLQKVVELNPDHAEAQFAKGELAMLIGDLSGADEAAAALLRIQPQSHEYYQLASAVAIARQEWSVARGLLENGLGEFGNSAELWGLKGVIAKKNEQWAEALDCLDKAISFTENDLQYRMLRMEVNQMRGDFDATVVDLTALIANSKDPQAQVIQLAKLIHERDGAEAAVARLTDYIDQYPAAYALQTLHVDLIKTIDPQRAGSLLDTYIQQATDPTGLLFYRVYAALANNHAAIAKQDLEFIIASSPADRAQVEASALLAELAWLAEDYAKADTLTSRALDLDSGHERALLLKAKLLTRANRSGEAVIYLNKLLNKNAGAVSALEMLAAYYQRQGKDGLAGDFYSRLLQSDPTHYQALQFQIAQDFSKGHLTTTDASLARALESYPNDISLLSVKLQVAAMRGRTEQAEALLGKLKTMGVNRADILFFEGFIAQKQKQHMLAVARFGEALDSRDRFDKALNAMYESAQAASAMDEFKRFLRERSMAVPDDLSAQLMLASLLAPSDSDGAAALLQAALTAHPEWVEGKVALSEIYRQSGRPNEALDLLKAAYTGSKDISAGVAYTQQLQRAGSFTDAGLIYEQLLQAHPEHTVVRNNYANLLLGALYSSQAARKALQLSEGFASSDNPALLDTYGMALTRAGKYSEAVHTLRKALDVADLPAIRLHYAQALYGSGKPEAAQVIIAELVQHLDKEKDSALLRELEAFKSSIKN